MLLSFQFHQDSDTPLLSTPEDNHSACSQGADELGFTEKVADELSYGDLDDDAISVASTTSTEAYEHEPFEKFQLKVREVCTNTLLQNKNCGMWVERMAGGSYNRVIGVTVLPSEPKKFTFAWFQYQLVKHFSLKDDNQNICQPRRFTFQWFRKHLLRLFPKVNTRTDEAKYIVRIPRDEPEDDDMSCNVAVQEFAHSRLCLPIADIVSLDLTANNVLSLPYTIQTRLSGQSAHDHLLNSLNLEQRKCFLREVVRVLSEMHTVTNTSAGDINPVTISDVEPQLLQFPVPRFTINGPPPKQVAKPKLTTADFLLQWCQRWSTGPGEFHADTIWSKFEVIIRALHKKGFLPDTDRFHLVHEDLVGRNILITIVDDETVKITGLVDWDAEYVFFAPKFMAYQAPLWMWVDMEDDGRHPETKAFDTPTESTLAELKKDFQQLAGEEWNRYAFVPEYVLLRRMFHVLRSGAQSPEHSAEAKEIFRDWVELYPDTEELEGALGLTKQ